MEIKVRDLGELESKSTQEIEKELLEKHEAQQEAQENVEPKDEMDRVNLQEAPTQEEKVEEEKVEEPVAAPVEAAAPEMSETDVLSYIANKYGEEVTSLDDFIVKRNSSEELPEDVKAYFEYKKETGVFGHEYKWDFNRYHHSLVKVDHRKRNLFANLKL